MTAYIDFTLEVTKVRKPYVTGPCPHNQTLCAKIALANDGDCLSDCSLCNPHHYITDVRQRHYPVPAIPLEVEYYPDPLIVIIGTMAVDDQDLNEQRYWQSVARY